MTTSTDARSILEAIVGYSRDEQNAEQPEDRAVKIATVDTLFDPTAAAAARVTFDGETVKTVRAYPWLGAPPAAGSRVVLIPVGRSYVIAGPIGQIIPAPGPEPFRAFREAAGTFDLPGIAVGASVDITVDFPSGRFTVPPIPTVEVGTTRVDGVQVSSVTKDAMVLRFTNWTSGGSAATTGWWTARQMTPTSAAG